MKVLDARYQVKTKALDEGNCGAVRRRGKEAGVKAASSRIETDYEAGDADELAPHNEVPVSASQVKSGVVPRKSRPLPGDGAKRRWPAVRGLPQRGERSEANLPGRRWTARAVDWHRPWQQRDGIRGQTLHFVIVPKYG